MIVDAGFFDTDFAGDFVKAESVVALSSYGTLGGIHDGSHRHLPRIAPQSGFEK